MQPATIPKVVFILGAGSSHGLGFPLGNELKDKLLTHLEPSNELFHALKASGFTEEQINKFSRQLQKAEYDTIDQHLREINDPLTRDIGKRAVAYLIRMMESADLSHRNDRARHWYKIFLDHLGRNRGHISPSCFSFITYNYDRSFPYYVFDTLQNRGIPESSLKVFLGSLNLIHVHGHVGELPWQFETGGDRKSYFQYGARLSPTDLSAHIPTILLPDEERELGVLLARLVGDAQIVVFVGFGFHEANMRLLPFDTALSNAVIPRRFISINTAPPPKDLLLGGRPIRHLQGKVDTVMPDFFRDLVSGELLLEKN
jgi:hypothetical protein